MNGLKLILLVLLTVVFAWIFSLVFCRVEYYTGENSLVDGLGSDFQQYDDIFKNIYTFENKIKHFTAAETLKFVSEKLDPEMFMNATQLITSKGLPCEEHFPHTEDGFILGMQRIPHHSSKGPPVLLMHGLLSSSDCFLTNLINESLAYILHNAGFDVWLGNVRGNVYSKKHEYYSPDELKFWAWSFDEMGQYDIPAMVEYIINTTGHPKINYIGHSQGATSMLAAGMHKKGFNAKINKFIALAPAGLVPNMKSPMHYLTYIAGNIKMLYSLFGDGEFLPHTGWLSAVAKIICPETEKLCENVLFLFGGADAANINITRVPVYTAHNPAGTSTQNMIHWAQMVKNKHNNMLHYDYGYWYLNLKHYHSIYPPVYDFSEFDISMYAFCGGSDTLVVPNDCAKLLSLLPDIKHSYFIPEYTHLDFIWAVNAAITVYKTVLDILLL
ncbi:gastric triacylglycerol lipase-like [Clavelina lepadiformis]|uniref:gastric triacylglycerol lipase-like n=1 Tax=Clavelina lepadiformis TaxID=159417 RepID=UPI004041D3F4